MADINLPGMLVPFTPWSKDWLVCKGSPGRGLDCLLPSGVTIGGFVFAITAKINLILIASPRKILFLLLQYLATIQNYETFSFNSTFFPSKVTIILYKYSTIH